MVLEDLMIDPEYEREIPPLTDDEFTLLEENIVKDGKILQPLVVWNNTILDGHNRYKILKKHPEIPFDTVEIVFSDKPAAIAWICRNQLGRRNLTPDQKRYLMGKQYKSEKASHGAEDGFRGNQYIDNLVSLQNEDLPKSEKTSERIARENGTSKSYVERAEKYADGVDAADEALPGIRQEILSGKIHPTQTAVTAIALASPEERTRLAEQLRYPKLKQEEPATPNEMTDIDSDENETEENITPVRVPKKKEILALAESMNHSEGQAIGTVEDMIYEMNSALQDMIFRWNFCREAYAGPVRHKDGKRQIKELAAEGIEYFKAVRKGALWKDEQICDQ